MTLKDALELGRKQHLLGNLEAAEVMYREILRVKPQQQEALHFLGLLAFQTGHPEHALELLVNAVEVDGGYVDAINNLGNVLMRLGLVDRAEFAYRRAIELSPRFAEPCWNLAAVLNLKGQSEEAVECCLKAIRLTPEADGIEFQSGHDLASQGKPGDAAEAYLKSLSRRRFQPDLYNNLGHALARLGKLNEAAEVYRSWIRIDPDNPRPRHHLACCLGENIPARASDEYVRQTFDRFASSFDKVLERLKYSAPPRMAELIQAQLGTGVPCNVLLDAGCGTGLCGSHLKPLTRQLVGVDLSQGMLDKARSRQLYDELQQAELTEFLNRQPAAYDVICSGDVLEYFGDLTGVFAAAARSLRPGGLFVFTVEKAEPDTHQSGYCLQYHGRYAHSGDYLDRTLEAQGFVVPVREEFFLRTEAGLPVNGWLVAARCPSHPPSA